MSSRPDAAKLQAEPRTQREVSVEPSVELDENLARGVYWATFLTANIDHVNIQPSILERYQRLLLAGIWSNVLVQYDDSITYGKRTFPFVITRLEPVQVGSVDFGAYFLIELGPRQTGKSFCFTEFSPYGTLLAGGAVTVPKLFVCNTQPPRKGLIANCDVVGFDEIAGSAFDADDNKNLYKNYIVPSCVSAGRGCRAGAMLVVGGTTLSGAPHASR